MEIIDYQIQKMKRKCRSGANYIRHFFIWVSISMVVGLFGGLVGSLFHIFIEKGTEFRESNPWMIFLLPLAGLLIVFIYRITKTDENLGTNLVFESIRTDQKVPFVMAPNIFISSVLTHITGGSAGREGAALQLGGSIGFFLGRIFQLDEKDMHLITLCGMSGVFAALFGTPLTAAIFAMEVVSVGVIYYSGFIPCITSALVAFGVSLLFGIKPLKFETILTPDFSIDMTIRVILLAMLCGLVSIMFCVIMKKTHKWMKYFLKNDYFRAFTGGVIIVLLTILIGNTDYNGTGMGIIQRAMNGNAEGMAFLLKIIFTAITLGAGFKGGEIVPTLFIGSTFGCFFGGLLGIEPGFAAALGFVGVFCGVVNIPITAIFLSVEIFGAQGILYFAVITGITNLLSGNYGLYSSQKILYSKLKAEYINIHAK